MAVYLKSNRKSEKKQSSNQAISWVASGACLGLGVVLGYGVFPAYCGMLAASQIPTISVPLIGAALTESSKIQAMTGAYNYAMTFAPVVAAGSASLLKGAVLYAMPTPAKSDDTDLKLVEAPTQAA